MNLPPVQSFARTREHLLRTNRLWGLASRAVTMLLGFASVNLALQYLGSQGYGVWLALVTIPGWLTLLEFGTGPLLRNRIAQASATAATDHMRETLGVAFRFLVAIAALGMVLSLVTLPWVPWKRLLGLGVASSSNVPAAAWILVTVSVLSLPFAVASHLVVGLQRGYLVEISQMASAVLVVTGLLLLNHIVPLKNFLFGVLILGVLPQAVAVAFFFLVFWSRTYCSLCPTLGRGGRSIGLFLGRQQWFFFGQHASSLVAPLGESLVILHLLSPEAVAQAGVIQRWYLSIAVLQSTLMAPLHPAYAEAVSRGDIAWTRETLARFSRRSWTLMGLAGVALLFGQPWYTQLVGRGVIESDLWLGVMFCLRAHQNAWGGSYATFLTAIGRIERLMLYNWLGAVLYLPFAVALGSVWGSKGVVLGGVLAYTPVALSNWLQAGRAIQESVGFAATEGTA